MNKEIVKELNGGRTKILLINLVYFVTLMIVGYLIFVQGASATWLYVVVGVSLIAYFTLIRKATRKHVQKIREAIYMATTFRKVKDLSRDVKSGVTKEQLLETGLLLDEKPESFYSKQLTTGTLDQCRLTMADVSFPIHENGKTSVFSGLYIHLESKNAQAQPLAVRAGDIKNVEADHQQTELLKDMASFVPGNMYLKIDNDHADYLFRGRYIDYRINPLLEVSERQMATDPLPEVAQAVKLFTLRKAMKK